MSARLLIVALAACGGGNPAGVDAAGDAVASHDAAPSALGVLFVNEVMASNTAACPDEFGELDDWAELYNAGDTDLDLTGYSVTDETATPAKAVLPAGVIVPAHGYKLIWCDGQVQGPAHVSFKLSATGEAFAIYTPGGELIDQLGFGAATTDVSFARLPDGTGAFVSCTRSTCGASNGASCP